MATITKGDLVNQALSLLRISGLTREPTPEDMSTIIMALEDMVTSWVNDGLSITYTRAGQAGPDPADESGVSQNNEKAVKYNLAIEAADYFGMAVSPRLAGQAESTKRSLYDVVPPVNYQNQFQAAGAGNQYHCADRYFQRFMPRDDRLTVQTPNDSGNTPVRNVAGAEASDFDFDPGLSASENISSLSFANDVIYMHSAGFLNLYGTDGMRASTTRLDLIGIQGLVIAVTTSATHGLILLINNGGVVTLQALSASAPHTPGAVIATITSDGIPSFLADIAESSDGDIYLADADSVRVYNSSGVLQTTMDIGAQTSNAKAITFVGDDHWVIGGSTAYRYIGAVYTGNNFATTETQTFGLAWDNANFWEGGASTDRIFRRKAIETNEG